jgi:hypothetical protein
LGQAHLSEAYGAAAAVGQGSFIMSAQLPNAAVNWVDQLWADSMRQRSPARPMQRSRTCLLRVQQEEWVSWNARLHRLVQGLDNLQNQMNLQDPDVMTGKAQFERMSVNKGPNVPAQGNIILVWRACGGSDADIDAMSIHGPKDWGEAGFGHGHYTAYEASYAACRADSDSRIQSNERGERALVLFAMATANVRIITRAGDYTRGEWFSDRCSRDPSQKKAMLATVDTYFAPVKQFPGVCGHQACPDAEANAHEVIAGDDAQLLPLAVVYYRHR